jgi:hypothetical protein
MASRTPLLLAAACFLIPGAVFAQVPSPTAPPEVDQALRARVTEFFQDFIDGKFRQAINLVADDTQDYYFSSPKLEMRSFKIENVTYSDDWTKATVHMTVTRIWRMRAEGFAKDADVPGPMDTTWKIENGKWVFYAKLKSDGWLTPMGPSADVSSAATAAATDKKKINDGTMAAEAQRILAESGIVTEVTPKEVTLALDKPSSAKVTFRNGVPGSVGLSLLGLPKDLPGFSATLEKTNVNSGDSTTVELSFDPSAGLPERHSVTIHVIVSPFDMEFPVTVDFGPPWQ